MKRFKSVDAYINSADSPEKETLIRLRNILNETELVETVKWGMPVYTINNKNVAGIGYFKSYTGLWFYQGFFLSDPENKLINAQEGTTKGMRQWRFKSLDEIDRELVIRYLQEAIKNQKEGKEIKPAKKPLVIPNELQEVLNADANLNKCFQEFGLTKKREFADYISEAKRQETKVKRLEKIRPMILSGIGLNDKYR